MERIDLDDQMCIAHLVGGREPTLEVKDPYGKIYITDDTDLVDKQEVFRKGYKLVQQYCKGYEWLDMPQDSVGISLIRLKQLKKREILRKLF